jgi:hypothetical protein
MSNAIDKKLAAIGSPAKKPPKPVVVTKKKKESLPDHPSKPSKRQPVRKVPKMSSVASDKLAAMRNEMNRVRDSSTSSDTGILPAHSNEFQDDHDDDVDDDRMNLYQPTLNTSYCPILSELQQHGVCVLATSVCVAAVREEVSEVIKRSDKQWNAPLGPGC